MLEITVSVPVHKLGAIAEELKAYSDDCIADIHEAAEINDIEWLENLHACKDLWDDLLKEIMAAIEIQVGS